MPELPETLPFTPLGDFIGEVGKPPTRTAMHTYLMRLREQGFDVSATVRKAVACGVRLDKEVRQPACRRPHVLALWCQAVLSPATCHGKEVRTGPVHEDTGQVQAGRFEPL